MDAHFGLPRFARQLVLLFALATDHLFPSCRSGGAIMIMSLLLFETEFQNIVAISFTALILNELIMVALEITTWSVSPCVLCSPS